VFFSQPSRAARAAVGCSPSNAITLPTQAISSWVEQSIGFCKLVPVLTMGSDCVLCGDTQAAMVIHKFGYWFEVRRVYTAAMHAT
jgi:hypothetical protein